MMKRSLRKWCIVSYHAFFYLLLSMIFLPVFGCGNGDRPCLGTVHGTVTLDGKPLADAALIFEPLDPGRASTGKTDDKGHYELIYIRQDKGAKVGSHKVRIRAEDPDANGKELLLPRYHSETILTAEVSSGDNTIDFPLTSK